MDVRTGRPGPKIGFVINDFLVGGAEVLLRDLLATARRRSRSADWCVVYALDGAGPLKKEIQDLGYHIVIVGFSWPFNPIAVFRFARRLRRDGIDILHCHLARSGVIGRIAARLARVPVIYTEHSMWGHHHPVTRVLNQLTLHWNVRVITVSEAVRQYVLGRSRIAPGRVITIPNGIDLSRLDVASLDDGGAVRNSLQIPEGVVVIGTVGNISRVKGHAYLVQALADLQRRGRAVHGVIVGRDRGDLPSLRELINLLGLERAVTIAGFREDIPEVLRVFDVFVLPSVQEGFGIALLEAMALQRPLVVSAVGGIREIVRHEVEGLVVPPANSRALADAIDMLLTRPEWARLLGERARQRVSAEFSLDRVAQRYQEAYAQVYGVA